LQRACIIRQNRIQWIQLKIYYGNSNMRAWIIEQIGSPAVQKQVPDTLPAKGEALISIAACGLNFADLLMQDGAYQERPPLPFIPGMEIAGTVMALGPDTAGPALGTRVAVLAGWGGLAQQGCFPTSHMVPLPQSMPFTHAAAFQIAYGTSHIALNHRARLQPDETLLVLGAAGGVGLTAVELGKKMGARVIASARGAERLAIAKAAGADILIDSDTGDLKDQLKAQGGVDVVYDPVGGAGFDAALRATKPEGRILTIGFASGQVPQIPANILLVKNLTVMGLYFGGYQSFSPDVLKSSLATLLDWYATGSLHPHISHTLPFDQLHDGMNLLRTRAATGKVVITMGN
jgi:NADPH:quinone reductase